jgi:hypothetical protein
MPVVKLATGLTFFFSQGAQGNLGAPSESQLDAEFGTTEEEKIIVKILEGGESQAMDVCSRLALSPHNIALY